MTVTPFPSPALHDFVEAFAACEEALLREMRAAKADRRDAVVSACARGQVLLSELRIELSAARRGAALPAGRTMDEAMAFMWSGDFAGDHSRSFPRFRDLYAARDRYGAVHP